MKPQTGVGKLPKENAQVCRTFFPKTSKDYTQGQPQYTLLKKEKHNIITGEIVVQYDRLTPSPNIAKKDSPIVNKIAL